MCVVNEDDEYKTINKISRIIFKQLTTQITLSTFDDINFGITEFTYLVFNIPYQVNTLPYIAVVNYSTLTKVNRYTL